MLKGAGFRGSRMHFVQVLVSSSRGEAYYRGGARHERGLSNREALAVEGSRGQKVVVRRV